MVAESSNHLELANVLRSPFLICCLQLSDFLRMAVSQIVSFARVSFDIEQFQRQVINNRSNIQGPMAHSSSDFRWS